MLQLADFCFFFLEADDDERSPTNFEVRLTSTARARPKQNHFPATPACQTLNMRLLPTAYIFCHSKLGCRVFFSKLYFYNLSGVRAMVLHSCHRMLFYSSLFFFLQLVRLLSHMLSPQQPVQQRCFVLDHLSPKTLPSLFQSLMQTSLSHKVQFSTCILSLSLFLPLCSSNLKYWFMYDSFVIGIAFLAFTHGIWCNMISLQRCFVCLPFMDDEDSGTSQNGKCVTVTTLQFTWVLQKV